MSRAKIGLSTLFCLGESFTSLLKRLHEVDVRYVEILDEGLHTINGRRIKALKKIAQLHDLELTLHAPFVDINIASPVPSLRRIFLKRLEKSIFYASQLNCRLWVFHSGRKTGVKNKKTLGTTREWDGERSSSGFLGSDPYVQDAVGDVEGAGKGLALADGAIELPLLTQLDNLVA